MKTVIGVSVLALSFSLQLNSVPALGQKDSCSAANGCVLDLLTEIIKTYRPSGEESKIRDYIKGKVTTAVSVWPRGTAPVLQEDSMGNILVRILPTGRFATKIPRAPRVITLQAHMDIVLSVKGAAAGEDLRPYYANGVDLVKDPDGWWHSRDNKTSLGADNGVGIALALAFALDPNVEHPALQLLFTVQEESGLKGARGLGFSLADSIMLNLDALEANNARAVVRGGMGGNSNRIKGEIDSASVPNSWRAIQISVKGLLGGHSGADIGKPRVNSVLLFSRMVEWLVQKGVNFSVVSVSAGQLANQIPSTIEATLVGDPTTFPKDVELMLKNWLNQQVCAVGSEECDNPAKQIFVGPAPVEAGQQMLTSDFTHRLSETLIGMPNGVIVTDPSEANGILVSSNVGALIATPLSKVAKMHTEFAFFTRSFENVEIAKTVDRILTSYHSIFPKGALHITNNLNVAGWLMAESHWLVQLAMSDPTQHFVHTNLSLGANENAVFQTQFPGLSMLSMGPQILNAHSYNERLQIDSLKTLDRDLRWLLEKIGDQQ